jgi:ubiquinone/menaquinone biosynthesis C-methylase UbiE
MNWLFILLTIIVVGLVLYWLLVTTEGVFLGRRVVILLYDLTANNYDGIKEFNAEFERQTISKVLLGELIERPKAWVLDVATGTGRVPILLLEDPKFGGRIVGLDAAGRMLAQARAKTDELPVPIRERVTWVKQSAMRLPFADSTFDVISCLEALEFFPSDQSALEEMVRLLQPGGFLVTSRRRGCNAYLFLGRYRSVKNFERLLADLGLVQVRTYLWQLDYDMVTARKSSIDKM